MLETLYFILIFAMSTLVVVFLLQSTWDWGKPNYIKPTDLGGIKVNKTTLDYQMSITSLVLSGEVIKDIASNKPFKRQWGVIYRAAKQLSDNHDSMPFNEYFGRLKALSLMFHPNRLEESADVLEKVDKLRKFAESVKVRKFHDDSLIDPFDIYIGLHNAIVVMD